MIEDRHGACARCDGPICRYPNPGMADKWAHRRPSDWIDNPHEAIPAGVIANA